MMRRIRQWLRVVLPIDQVAYLVLAMLLAMLAVRYVRDRGSQDDLIKWQICIVYGSTLLYAAFRAIYFHPIENRRYGQWLADSPWQHPQPLPLGPLHLVWQDALLILLAAALLPTELLSAWSVPIAFLLMYCFAHGYSFFRMRIYQPVFVMALLLGALILAIPNAKWCALFALAMYGAACWGIQRLLARLSDGEEIPPHLGWGLPTERVEPLLGWPVPPMATERFQWTISHADAIRLAVAVAWLFFCVAWQCRDATRIEQGLQNALATIAVVAMATRVLIYVVGYLPPISLLGRFFTGRWIIPGYDVVFVAPLAAALTAWALPKAALALGVSSEIFYAASAGVVVWLTLALPPHRGDWQLTGHHRIAYRLRPAVYEKSAASKMIPRTQ